MSNLRPGVRRTHLATVALVTMSLGLAACNLASGADPRGFAGASATTATDFPSIIPTLATRASLPTAPAGEPHATYAPDLPAASTRSTQAIFDVHLEVLEGVCPLDPANGVTTVMWGFRINGDAQVTCGSPGPVLRGRVGDMMRVTLTNPATNSMAHNIDFHAVTGQGGGAADLTVGPGETRTIEARLLYSGAFMYHCAFGDVPEHITKGMYGMVVVDPELPLPAVDHEWAVMQSEWYVDAPDAAGFAAYNRQTVTDENPRYVTFNGRTDALTGENSLQMAVGERARIYMVNEGLNLDSNLHPIGSHWDAVWPEAATHPSNVPIRGSQSTLVVAGGGVVVDLIGQVPSTILLVDHALARTFDKGAIGLVVVSGNANPELFASVDPGRPDQPAASAPPSTPATPAGTADEATTRVVIPAGAYDPANAETAFSPRRIVVPVGATVTWSNEDIIVHTVTSGVSDTRQGTPDGTFDSGDIAPGETFEATFDEAGTFAYFCTPHPWMTGEVVVEAG